jgi:hypothetical protein
MRDKGGSAHGQSALILQATPIHPPHQVPASSAASAAAAAAARTGVILLLQVRLSLEAAGDEVTVTRFQGGIAGALAPPVI